MELTRGIIGLTQNQAVLHHFFLIAPFLSVLSKEFYDKNQITRVDYLQHYQTTGLTNQRISNNVKKIIQVYDTFNLDFKDNAHVSMLSETATNILSHEDIGKEMHQSIVDQIIKGEVSIWSTLKKRNLKTFRMQGKSIKTNIGEKVAQLKEEHTLLSCF